MKNFAQLTNSEAHPTIKKIKALGFQDMQKAYFVDGVYCLKPFDKPYEVTPDFQEATWSFRLDEKDKCFILELRMDDDGSERYPVMKLSLTKVYKRGERHSYLNVEFRDIMEREIPNIPSMMAHLEKMVEIK